MTWWISLNRFITARRLSYAWIVGIALWLAWLLSTLLGPGNMDLAGQVIGTDYLQFYAAGTTLQQGQSAYLYDFTYQSKLEQNIAGAGLTSFHAFLTPPFLAWLYVPLSFLPYGWSFVSWSLLGLLFLWLSFILIGSGQPGRHILWSLTWFPIFASISFGQNSLLSLFLFSLTYFLLRRDKCFPAGLVSSLLLFKPQMVLGIALLWLLELRKDWKAVLGLLLGGITLAGLCFWLMPEASQAYLVLARDFLGGLIYGDQFPLWHLHSLRGFWVLLFPGNRWLPEGLSLLLSGLGVVGFIMLWRNNRKEYDLLYAGALCLTIWITPHAMIYDWNILLIAALIFWRERPNLLPFWKVLFSMIWIATLISGPLTYGQLKIFPIAIQISIPVLTFVYFTIYQKLMVNKGENNNWKFEKS